MSAGDTHACAIRADGTLACWGDNGLGQTDAPADAFLQVSAGNRYSCGLKVDGKVACWGDDTYEKASPPGDTFRQVSTGNSHSCGIKDDGILVCWGNSLAFPASPEGAFAQVDAGAANTCALRTDGTVACWGSSRYGVTTPPQGSFTQISVAQGHACAARSDGMIVCWGSNSHELLVSVGPAALSAGAVGAPYSQALTAVGGTAPYTFGLVAGALPPGLELSAEGLLSGTPTELGTSAFTVQVVDANSLLTTRGTRAGSTICPAAGHRRPGRRDRRRR